MEPGTRAGKKTDPMCIRGGATEVGWVGLQVSVSKLSPNNGSR